VAFAAAAITGRDLRVDRDAPAVPRIGILRQHPWTPASAEMQDALEAAAGAAMAAGAKVIELKLPPIMQNAFAAQFVVQDYESFRALAFEYDRHRDQIGAPLRAVLDRAATISDDDYDAARRTATRARQACNDLVGECDVLLTPSAPGAAPRGFGSERRRFAAWRSGRRPLRPRPRYARGGALSGTRYRAKVNK
jgi:Asp-tRNA(Asn)/Glu-tRNA(Gln) amidotransferase A subunit family amidase